MNKTVVYNTWRLDNLLSLSEIEEIENLCGEMMGLYGYFKVGDNLEKYKDFQTDFVDSESQFNLLWISAFISTNKLQAAQNIQM